MRRVWEKRRLRAREAAECERYRKQHERAERRKKCKRIKCALIAISALLLFLFGRDVALIVVHSVNECALDTEHGQSALFHSENVSVSLSLSDWIWTAVGTHLALCLMLFCSAVVQPIAPKPPGSMCVPHIGWCILFGWLFLLVWSVIGFVLLSEMSPDGHANKQCRDAVLAWTVMQTVEWVIVQCFIEHFFIRLALSGYYDSEDLADVLNALCLSVAGSGWW